MGSRFSRKSIYLLNWDHNFLRSFDSLCTSFLALKLTVRSHWTILFQNCFSLNHLTWKIRMINVKKKYIWDPNAGVVQYWNGLWLATVFERGNIKAFQKWISKIFLCFLLVIVCIEVENNNFPCVVSCLSSCQLNSYCDAL